MSSSAIGTYHRINKRKGQIYVPVDLVQDSQFPFQGTTSVVIKLGRTGAPGKPNSLIITEKQ